MILAILQARMSSTRLPGKVLKRIVNRPMMGLQIDRLRRAVKIDRLVVATSVETTDDPIVSFCAAEHVDCYRGELIDVLSRYYGAAQAFGPANHIVRVTADCPLIDPQVVDECIALHLKTGADYTSNGVDRTYPDGLDVELMNNATLKAAFQMAEGKEEREHVTMYIYRHPECFRIAQLTQVPNLSALRWTVDVLADFEFVTAVYEGLHSVNPAFSQTDVLDFLSKYPEIGRLNARDLASNKG